MVFPSDTTTAMLAALTYHYVRPVASSAFPRLKALELDGFVGQLDHLQAHYRIISPAEFLAALDAREPLPPRACLLTFDDGYADHYRHVLPRLAERGLGGLFFAPKSSLLDRQLLDVNRIQFTLASHRQPEALADELDGILRAEDAVDVTQLRAAHFAPNRFDGPEIAYVKRLLQHALSPELRSRIAKALFAVHVSADEAGFAEALYLTPAQAREMRSQGMEFGGHGDRHLWHGVTSHEDLVAEVRGAATVLQAIDAPVQGGVYCYPFGNETAAVRKEITKAGFRAGFTVVPDLWSPEADPLRIPRLDTNHLPHRPDAGDPWLARFGPHAT